jgi:hypothetical protein
MTINQIVIHFFLDSTNDKNSSPYPLLLQREGGVDHLIMYKFDYDSPLVILSGVEGKRGVG